MADDNANDHGANTGGDQQGTQQGETPKNEPAFPANTPVAEMTHEQQAAYYKHQNRKQEERNKAVGLTPEEAAQLRARAKQADDYEAANASEIEKREKAARDAAETDAAAKYRPMLAETAFRVAIGDRKPQEQIDTFISEMNLDRFLDDNGRVDTARVLARVEQFAPAMGNQQQAQRGPSSNGQGQRPATPQSSVASGQDMWRERHPSRT